MQQVTAQQARGVMRGLESKLKADFSALEGAKGLRDKKHLAYRIVFPAHPIRAVLAEIVPAQQYAIVIVTVTETDKGASRATDEEVKLATRKVWVMGSASTRQRAKGFCPARLQILVDPTHTCNQCEGVERVTEGPQEGEDFTKKMVESVLPVLRDVLRQH